MWSILIKICCPVVQDTTDNSYINLRTLRICMQNSFCFSGLVAYETFPSTQSTGRSTHNMSPVSNALSFLTVTDVVAEPWKGPPNSIQKHNPFSPDPHLHPTSDSLMASRFGVGLETRERERERGKEKGRERQRDRQKRGWG